MISHNNHIPIVGVPKDPNYIYRLHMALKRYEDASKTALIIAKQEQDLGNYPLAHSVVTETIRNLEDAFIKISLQMRQMFILLHSYMLVKVMVRHNDHISAARLLLRVSSNISKFPQHIVPILTSTVIECQRAGLKASAYEYATILMRPEHRSNIDVNIRRKIEAIVRRKASNLMDEVAEDETECPVSNDSTTMGCYQLESPKTRDAVPMCVITGKHMVLNDWCFCPNSKYPALYSEYLKYIEREKQLMASKEITSSDSDNPAVNAEDEIQRPMPPSPVTRSTASVIILDPVVGKPLKVQGIKPASVADAMKYIQRYNNIFEEKKGASVVGNQDEGEVSEDGSRSGEGRDEEDNDTDDGHRAMQRRSVKA
jgi:WD repeat-containing protein 19